MSTVNMIFPSQSTMEVQISSKIMQDHGAFRYIILYIEKKMNQIYTPFNYNLYHKDS